MALRWYVLLKLVAGSPSLPTFVTKPFAAFRLSCMSATYCNHLSRRKILEAITWSFQCLCNLDSAPHMLQESNKPDSLFRLMLKNVMWKPNIPNN